MLRVSNTDATQDKNTGFEGTKDTGSKQNHLEIKERQAKEQQVSSEEAVVASVTTKSLLKK